MLRNSLACLVAAVLLASPASYGADKCRAAKENEKKQETAAKNSMAKVAAAEQGVKNAQKKSQKEQAAAKNNLTQAKKEAEKASVMHKQAKVAASSCK